MTRPRYQGVNAVDIPAWKGYRWQVRVVAGEVESIHGPVKEIAANPIYLEVAMEVESTFNLSVPGGHTALAYVFDGQGSFGGHEVSAVNLVVFGYGDEIEVRTKNTPARFMLMAGAPIGEPIVPYGPFVMNTRSEIQQALADLRDGTFVQKE